MKEYSSKETHETKFYDRIMKLGAMTGCHQLPEISLFVFGKQMPVCARCFGCFCGYLLALITVWFINIPLYFLPILCIPMGIDYLLQYKGILPSTNLRRVLTGIPCGFAFNYIYIRGLIRLIKMLCFLLP